MTFCLNTWVFCVNAKIAMRENVNVNANVGELSGLRNLVKCISDQFWWRKW
jgi:hypothetical protein